MEQLKIRDKTIFDGPIFKRVLRAFTPSGFCLSGKAINVAPKVGITIAAPHTSNWDIIFALGAAPLLRRCQNLLFHQGKLAGCQSLGLIMLWLGGNHRPLPPEWSSRVNPAIH